MISDTFEIIAVYFGLPILPNATQFFIGRLKKQDNWNSSSSKSLLYVTFRHKWSFKWHGNTRKTLWSIDEMNDV